MSSAGAIGGSGALPVPSKTEVDEGLRPDGVVKKQLKRWANSHLDDVVARTVEAHGLDAQETNQLRSALTGTKDAKLREYWQERGPAESFGLLARGAAAAGAMIAIGLASPIALIPAAIGVAVGLGGRAAVVYKKLEHALEGKAAVELSKIEKARGVQPAEPSRVDKVAHKMAARTVEENAERYGLDEAQRAHLAEAVAETRINKVEELWHSRLPVELGSLAATAAVTAGVSVGLGVMGALGAVIMGAGAVVGAAVTVGFAFLKLRSALEGTAHAVVEEFAPHAPEGSPLREVAEVEGAREKKALESAARVRDKFVERHKLTPAQATELDKRLTKAAHLKRKELWDHRLGPTMASPLGRGSAVAGFAGAVSGGDPTAVVGALVGSVAEAAVSATLLYRQLESALEGTAYAYVKSLRSAAQ